MKNKKILIVSIIIVIVLILALGAGIAFAYFATDIFKTDEELFFKYISQFGSVVEEFSETDLVNYFDKQETTPYENSGKLSFNVNVPEYKDILTHTNDFNISFNGKVDKLNNKKEQHYQINYSNSVNFPFDYKHTGDLYALASNIVANKYVAVRNSNLQETFVKMGLNPMAVGEIPDKIEIPQNDANISKQDIENFIKNYYEIIKTHLKETNFSKLNKNTFVLTLSKKELKVICIDLLQELKNDDTFNINSEIKEQLGKKIEELVTEIQTIEDSEEQALKITVSQSEGKLSKIELHTENTDITIQVAGTKITIHVFSTEIDILPVLTFEKVKLENEVQYLLSYKVEENQNTTEMYFTAKYINLALEKVDEHYVFGISNITTDTTTQELTETKYEYALDTTKNFSSEVNIEDLTEKTALILNDKDITYVRNTMNAIGIKIAQLNKSQMEKLGLNENQNPLFFITPIGYMFQGNNNVVQEQENQEQVNNLQNMMVQVTNQKFEKYLGDEVKGSDVKALLQLVTNTIEEDAEQIIKIIYNDQTLTPDVEIIKNIRNVINSVATYQVSFGYNSRTGLIDSVMIKVNSDSIVVRNPEVNEIDNSVNELNNEIQNGI